MYLDMFGYKYKNSQNNKLYLMNEQSKIKITSKKHFFDFQIKEILKFKDLIILLVKEISKFFTNKHYWVLYGI